MPFKFTQDDVEAIVANKNLLLRNLQITLGYHKIARGLQKLVSDRDVNWFGFGTYASKTAGQAIRHETLPPRIKSALIRAAGYNNTVGYLHAVLENTEEISAENVDNRLSEGLTQVSLLLSKGNLMIFGELAAPFVAFVHTFAKDWQPDNRKLEIFLDQHCRPGNVDVDGQDLVRESMTSFYRARFETDPKKKAELILLANLLVGLHEQTRLQPVIEKVLAVPFDIFTSGLMADNELHENLLQRVSQNVLGYSRNTVLRTVTRMMMSYSLPTRDLKLGRDLVAPTGMVNFPRELFTIENARCKEVISMFATLDQTLSGSAADNWGNLHDRMKFLADFFRSYQHYQKLLQPPFTPEQIASIEAGRFPAGEL